MPADERELTTLFHAALPFCLRALREHCGLRTLELSPRADSPLGLASDPAAAGTIRVPADSLVAPAVLVTHAWQVEEILFLRQVAGGVAAIDLVDVGANIGLFTRQAVLNVPQVRRAFAYEPAPANFACLAHNLRAFAATCEAVQAALAPAAGTLTFYLDPDNCGNYSLSAHAMPARYTTTEVQALAAAAESRRWAEGGRPIFYKSDVQGFDEVIAAALEPAFWDQVVGGIFELSRVEKPPHDGDRFAAVLDAFPHKAFLSAPQTPRSTAEVLAYLVGRDGQHEDLACWR